MMSSPPARRSPLAMVLLALLEEAPMHAYRMQQLIRERGKDSVVNVGSRNSIHQALDRLVRDGLIVAQPAMDKASRVTYAITGDGENALRLWLTDMLSRRRNEYPGFPAALSFVVLLTPELTADLLEARLEELDRELAEPTPAEVGRELDLDRIFLIEDEYLRTMATAERDWVRSIVAELRSGTLSWPDLRPDEAPHTHPGASGRLPQYRPDDEDEQSTRGC